MGFSPPLSAVPDMKTGSRLTVEGYIATFMTRSRKFFVLFII